MASETVVSRQRVGSIPITHPNFEVKLGEVLWPHPGPGTRKSWFNSKRPDQICNGEFKEQKYGVLIRLGFGPAQASHGVFVKGNVL